MHHLVGAAEVADMLGVSRQRVHQLAVQLGFPEPVVTLAAGKIWERAAIEAWLKTTGRTADRDESP